MDIAYTYHLCLLFNVFLKAINSDGKLVFAMDALFGLTRKKAAGASHRDPLHDRLFFCDQSAVDQFLADSTQQKASNVCIYQLQK